jgi:hypothetical protein
LQNAELQSRSASQAEPFTHGAHSPPPQSKELSAPFTIPSLQLGASQNPRSLHTPLSQWAPEPQRLPSAHALHAPPQSTSLSPVSWLPLSQPGATGAGVLPLAAGVCDGCAPEPPDVVADGYGVEMPVGFGVPAVWDAVAVPLSRFRSPPASVSAPTPKVVRRWLKSSKREKQPVVSSQQTQTSHWICSLGR